ncbi:MAG: hypothetical protein KF893_25540 [Caldilineaceae bacterium]|nr:hypothetical protein [Caldilineaceae bacterium]
MQLAISAGETLSEIADLGDQTLVGIEVPRAYDGGAVRFLASTDGTNFGRLMNSGAASEEVLLTGGAVVWLDSRRFPARYLRIKTEQPTGADLVFTLILKP